jgi:hypothetical protein
MFRSLNTIKFPHYESAIVLSIRNPVNKYVLSTRQRAYRVKKSIIISPFSEEIHAYPPIQTGLYTRSSIVRFAIL